MITDDHPATAGSTAEEAGLPAEEHALLTDSELTDLDDDELAQRMTQAAVIARITPLDKLRIVGFLQRRGHTAAMTGNGSTTPQLYVWLK